jgi:NAD(P) transhydrogenase subunit beta
MLDVTDIINPIYVATVLLFIVGLHRMSSPSTARSGIVGAGAAMLIATIATFFTPGLNNFALIGVGIVLGFGVGWSVEKRVRLA